MVFIFFWIAIIFWTVHWALLTKDNVFVWFLLATVVPPIAVMCILLSIDNDLPKKSTYKKRKNGNAYRASILAGNTHHIAQKDSTASRKRRKARGKTRYRHTHDEVRTVNSNARRR